MVVWLFANQDDMQGRVPRWFVVGNKHEVYFQVSWTMFSSLKMCIFKTNEWVGSQPYASVGGVGSECWQAYMARPARGDARSLGIVSGRAYSPTLFLALICLFAKPEREQTRMPVAVFEFRIE